MNDDDISTYRPALRCLDKMDTELGRIRESVERMHSLVDAFELAVICLTPEERQRFIAEVSMMTRKMMSLPKIRPIDKEYLS